MRQYDIFADRGWFRKIRFRCPHWVSYYGIAPSSHSLRRTKAALIYKRTGNLRAVQLLLGHTKIESTVKYLGVEVDDALDISEKVDI